MRIFKPEIMDKKCKHTWKKMTTTVKIDGGFLSGKGEITFDYFLCPKCNSTAGDTIE